MSIFQRRSFAAYLLPLLLCSCAGRVGPMWPNSRWAVVHKDQALAKWKGENFQLSRDQRVIVWPLESPGADDDWELEEGWVLINWYDKNQTPKVSVIQSNHLRPLRFHSPRVVNRRSIRRAFLRQHSDWRKQILKQLNHGVSVDWVDDPLEGCLAFFANISGVNIIFDPAVAAQGEFPVTIKAEKVKTLRIFEWTLLTWNLYYKVENDAVFVSTRDRLDLKPFQIRGLPVEQSHRLEK
jgi:hypothetical protein